MTLSIIQIVLAAALIVLILLQERSAGLSGIFGTETGFYQTRRGAERFVFGATVVFAIAFIALALVQLVR